MTFTTQETHQDILSHRNPDSDGAFASAEITSKDQRSPETWKYPALVAAISPSNFCLLKEAHEFDISELERNKEVSVRFREPFILFKIHDRNFKALNEYVRSLLVPLNGLSNSDKTEIDRHLMNYLSSARALIDQWQTFWERETKGTAAQGAFRRHVEKLEKLSPGFAFYQDLRNAAQHCCFPVGNYSRKASDQHVEVEITASPAFLLKAAPREFKRSKLSAADEPLQLMALAKEFHIYLMRDIGSFVVNKFSSTLMPVHNYFAQLSNDASKKKPHSSAMLLERFAKVGNDMNWTLEELPVNLFDELGIDVAPLDAQSDA